MIRNWSALVTVVCLLGMFAQDLPAQIKLGAIGDSLLDEHFDQSGNGTSLDYSRNAFEIMVETGRIDAGPKGNWGDDRKTGYQYNWALAGATTSSLISSGQHTSLASQIPVEGITHAVMIIGSNDLFPEEPTYDGFDPGTLGSDYETIYEGFASASQIEFYASAAVARVRLAAETLRATGVKLIVATPPEYGIAPLTKTLYTDPVKRARVDDVYELWTSKAIAELTAESQVPVVDLYGFTKQIFGDQGLENEFFQLGGVDLVLNGTAGVDLSDVLGGNPFTPIEDTADVFTHDGIHPNTVFNGMFANLFMTAYNEQYGSSMTLFSEQEMLALAGPNLGAQYTSDTLNASLSGKTYSDFIYGAVPEPALAGWSALMMGGLFCRRNRRLATV